MRLSYRTYCCWLGYVPVSDALYLLYFSRALSDWRLLRAMAAKPGMGIEKNVQFPFVQLKDAKTLRVLDGLNLIK
jgi:hypothetical protein